MLANKQKKMTIGILRAWVVFFAIATPGTLMSNSDPPPKFNPPKSYYLALGDSIAYGYQLPKVLAGLPPSAFDTGYVDDFAVRLRQIQPGITTVNYGCPGESTLSFINGPCPWSAAGQQLHSPFTGTQLDAAVAFLRSHPGEVSPITITLWANDIQDFALNVCHFDLACIQNGAPGVITQISTNLAFILGQLRAVAPDAEIIVTGAWDVIGFNAFASADPLIEALNVSLASAAAAARARFANPFPVFNPQGDPNLETQTICTLTQLCTVGDGHPSDAGYLALANVVFDVSGYAHLTE
jgi:lysophospholipase L1-like esterase